MTVRKKATASQQPLTTAQRLGSLLKTARDIMRKDKGLNGDLDRLPLLTWVMFLKFLDDHEQVRESRAAMKRAKEGGRKRFQPPFRSRYSSEDIADLYHHRWHVELDIRNIKQTLQMDVLSCKTPAMIRREVWAHLLAYNLVRKVLAQAALAGQVAPRQLSFSGAVDTMDAFRWVLAMWPAEDTRRMVQVLLAAVATHRVGNRPDRVEPREVKRRRAGLKFMMKTRAERRAELLAGIGA